MESVEPYIEKLKPYFKGPPGYLIIICFVQLVVLYVGILHGIGSQSCMLVETLNGVEIDCSQCFTFNPSFQKVVFLLGGTGVIGWGLSAGFLRKADWAVSYGAVMGMFAFVMFMSTLTSWLDYMVVRDASYQIDVTKIACRRIAKVMVDTRHHIAVFYLTNSLVDAGGAIFAVRASRHFEYTELRETQEETESLTQRL